VLVNSVEIYRRSRQKCPTHPRPLAPALEFVHVRRCAGVTDAASVAMRAAEGSVKVILWDHRGSARADGP
jgi:hypothetical protein